MPDAVLDEVDAVPDRGRGREGRKQQPPKPGRESTATPRFHIGRAGDDVAAKDCLRTNYSLVPSWREPVARGCSSPAWSASATVPARLRLLLRTELHVPRRVLGGYSRDPLPPSIGEPAGWASSRAGGDPDPDRPRRYHPAFAGPWLTHPRPGQRLGAADAWSPSAREGQDRRRKASRSWNRARRTDCADDARPVASEPPGLGSGAQGRRSTECQRAGGASWAARP